VSPRFLAILNLFYPLRCAACGKDLAYDSPSRICAPCLASIQEIPPHPRPAFVRSSLRYEGTAKDLIHKFKYSGKDYLAGSFAPYLKRVWLQDDEMKTADVIACVPSHPARLRDRGFNPSVALAREFAQAVEKPYIPALERVRNTPSQTELGREERARNMEGAFRVIDPAIIRGKRTLLVDDVCTTGSTLSECARTLRRAGSGEVFALTLALQNLV